MRLARRTGGRAAQESVTRRAEHGPALLSYAQERLWFFDQLVPGNPAYIMCRAFRLRGPLDVEILEGSLTAISERHAVLRTTYAVADGRPVQVAHPAVRLHLPVSDLSALPPSERDAALAASLSAEARRPFDLAADALLRGALVRLGMDEHVLLLCVHHIAFDAWSADILARELTTLYDAICDGLPSPLDELPLQYADYAMWQRQRVEGGLGARQLAYWKEQLAGEIPTLQLVTDHLRPPMQSFEGARRSLLLPPQLLQALKTFSRGERATLYMTLLAAYQVLLCRYAGQDEVVIGSPIAGRTRVETEPLIGCFINTLALRADLAGDPTFRQLLGQVRERALGAYIHADLPYERLVEELQPVRDLSRTPLFQVMFQLRNVPHRPGRSGRLLIEEIEVERGTAKFDLTLEAVEHPDGLGCQCEYATALFEAATVDRLLAHYQTLLEGIIANPDERVFHLPLLTEAERHCTLMEWNTTRRPYPREQGVHHLFEEQAWRTPAALAVVDGERRLTYGELNARANRLARRLRARGVGPEVPVGICLDRSLEFIVGALAILKAGGAYVPLDPTYPRARLTLMLEDTRAPVLLTLSALRSKLPDLLEHPSAEQTRIICLDAIEPELAEESMENPNGGATGENLAYVTYTSGSTGTPKGVAVPHRAINRLVMNTDYVQLGPDDVMAHVSSCSFDAATWEIWGTLLSGAHLVVVPQDIALSPQEFTMYLREQSVTAIFLTTALFNQIALAVPDAFHTLRHVLFGGEAANPNAVRRVLEGGAPARLLHVYGPTESTTFATWQLVERLGAEEHTVPIGRPIANTRTYVLDRHRQPVPMGIPGELYVGGDGLARGYLNRPELTAEKFVDDPFSEQQGARLYRTGDLVRYRPEGAIEFLGRLDHQVKIRGFRIEPEEVEAVLGQHPAVGQAFVLVRENPQSEKCLVAYVVPRAAAEIGREAGENVPLTARTLRRDLGERLPEYMLPSAFVFLDALPTAPTGKVDRRMLPPPDWSTPLEEFEGPRTATEEALTQIWADILGVERIGVHDDFFALGGHSLLATRVVSRVRDQFGVELTVRVLFEAPTVAALAERVGAPSAARPRGLRRPISPAPRTSDLPLSFTQERLWFLDQLAPGLPVYTVPLALRLTGPLDVNALQRSLGEIVQRHEVLRTTYPVDNGQPVQRIHSASPLALLLEDVSAPSRARREARGLKLAHEELRQPFDLAHGPLFRGRLLRLGAEDHILVLAIHHSVFDGWSIGVFYRELAALYAAFAHGEPSPLPVPDLQYGDFAVWQREHSRGDALAPYLGYWMKQLAGAPPLLQLPTDRPRPLTQIFNGAHYTFQLPRDLSEAMARLSQQEGTSLYMTLLAAFKTLLLRYTGQEDVVVGSPIAGRTRAETEGMIGCFLNTLVLRTDLSGDPAFRELLGRVREVALTGYAHQEVPFEQLVEALKPPREASYSPLVQVMFVLQNAPMEALHLPGLTVRPLDVELGTSKYDLTLELTETPEGLRGSLQYDTELFDTATMALLAEHFQVLLGGIVADPAQRLSQLPLLTPTERRQVLDDWNATAAAYPEDSSLVALFEAQMERTPEAVAFTCGGETLTYHELDRQSNQLARFLRRSGVRREVLVGVCLGRSLRLVVGLLGILKAGGAYVPLDPSYPAERLRYMLDDTQAPLVLTEQRFLDRLPRHEAQIVCLDRDWEVIAAEPFDRLGDSGASADNLAYVLYTSGSTGTPKGVAAEHRQVLNRLAWMWRAYPFATGEVGCQKTTINFVDSVWEIFGPLLQGVSTAIIPDEVLEDTSRFLDVLADEQVTRLWVVPSLLRALLDAYPDLQRRVPRLTFWAISGEALQPELVAQFERCLPASRLINIYGTSEFFDATSYECRRGDGSLATMPIGRLISNMQAYVLDAHLQPCPIGVPGELHIGGVGLVRGYLNRPELTAERFIPHPFRTDAGARLFRTGDLVRWRPDGQLEYLGRRDHQVKLRGFRIELAEIEVTLAAHPAVYQCVVVAREDVAREKQLVAYVVPHQERTVGDTLAQDLRRFTQEHLPRQMVPAVFIPLDALPLTPSGKVNRLALPAPERTRPEGGRPSVGPQNVREETLIGIWEGVLQVQPIDVEDDFFDLGGHSLLAVRLFARIEQAFGVELPLSTLFRAPTVRQLAAVLAQSQRDEDTIAQLPVLMQSGDARPPLFCVHTLGGEVFGYASLARHLGPDQSVYGLVASGVDGDGEVHTSLEEMAIHCINQLKGIQPTGPYFLCGVSAGGVIAFEIAQQLQRSGDEVALLAMLDASPPNLGKFHVEWSQEFVVRVTRDLAWYVVDYARNRTLQQRIASVRRYVGMIRRKIELWRRSERAAAAAPGAAKMLFDAWAQEWLAGMPERRQGPMMARMEALSRYTPQAYRGRITVFRAYSQRLLSAHLPDLGWGRFACGGVEVYRVPGDHTGIVLEPHVHVLAARLKACIAEAKNAAPA